jgi:ectoine hydroxylase-related dioxygenase (phytanoyl-CoA dioxygenase family)
MSLLRAGAAALDVAPAVEHFREHGWARLGRVVSDEALEALRARAEEIMLGRVVVDGLFFQHDASSGRYEDLPIGEGWVGPSRRYRKIEKLERDDRFRALLENALYERVVRALVAGPIAIYRAVLFSKADARGAPLPWHQDGGTFWGLDRDPTVQIWTALDDAPEEAGCVEVLPGSHHGGLATPLGGVVPEPLAVARGAQAGALPLPARAGEALLIHNHVWHRSAQNRTARPRRALTVCYMSAATRCLRKKRAPRSFVRVFEAGQAGVPRDQGWPPHHASEMST